MNHPVLMKRLTCCLFLCLVLLPPDYAEPGEGRWKLFGKSMTGTLWYMDTETMSSPAENIVAVWVKSVPDKTPATSGEEKEKTEALLRQIQEKYFGDYEYTDGLWELDCAASLFRVLYFCAFGSKGDVLTSRTSPDAEWSFILPGSAGEALLGAICSR